MEMREPNSRGLCFLKVVDRNEDAAHAGSSGRGDFGRNVLHCTDSSVGRNRSSEYRVGLAWHLGEGECDSDTLTNRYLHCLVDCVSTELLACAWRDTYEDPERSSR